MTTYAQKYMAAAIAKFELTIERKGGDVCWLQNQYCKIALENIDNDYVRFEFGRRETSDECWEFADYLDCMYEGRGMQLRPLPPKDHDNEAKFVFMLVKYDELIVGGYFERPLVGDFTWGQQYADCQSEYKRLSIARYRLEKAGHPAAVEILSRKLKGDPTWIDDVKRILAEQESKS